MANAATRRAGKRQSWPVVMTTLHSQPTDDLSASTTLEERIAMMRPLALAAWRVAGFPLPRYRRSRIPIRIQRRCDDQETGPAQPDDE